MTAAKLYILYLQNCQPCWRLDLGSSMCRDWSKTSYKLGSGSRASLSRRLDHTGWGPVWGYLTGKHERHSEAPSCTLRGLEMCVCVCIAQEVQNELQRSLPPKSSALFREEPATPDLWSSCPQEHLPWQVCEVLLVQSETALLPQWSLSVQEGNPEATKMVKGLEKGGSGRKHGWSFY